jgi:hypothetical protein
MFFYSIAANVQVLYTLALITGRGTNKYAQLSTVPAFRVQRIKTLSRFI